MIPSWSLPLGYLLLMISIGCVLAVIVNGCQVPMRDAMNRETDSTIRQIEFELEKAEQCCARLVSANSRTG